MRIALTVSIGLCAAMAVGQDLLVGREGATSGALKKATQSSGTLGGKLKNNLYGLYLKPGVSAKATAQRLKLAGFRVEEGRVLLADPTSKPSIDRYVGLYEGDGGKDGEESGAGYYEAIKYYLDARVDDSGQISQDLFRQSIAHREQMPKFGGGSQGQKTSGAWQFAGPRALGTPYRRYFGHQTLSGRKNAVAYGSALGTYYVASAGGGVWKTTNWGNSWTPLSDNWPSLAVTGIAVQPGNDNVVYAGTGDYYGIGRTQTFGIMKTLDGGQTWVNQGRADFGNAAVSRIKVDRFDTQIVLATTGAPGGGGGIWRSTTGGTGTWTSYRTDCRWDDIDVSADGRTYVAVGRDGFNRPVIATSTTAGQVWVPAPVPHNNPVGLSDIGVSRNNASTWFVIYSNMTMYKTTNGGLDWVPIVNALNAGVSDPATNWSQSGYDMCVECGYGGPNIDYVYVGLVTMLASPNGGQTFGDIGRTMEADALTHNDQHFVAVSPNTGQMAMVCNDGGIWSLTYVPGSGVTWANMNATFYDTAFYAMAGHPTNSNWLMGGTQDNASPASLGNLNQWANLQGGDGGWAAFDRTGATYYSTSQGGVVWMNRPAQGIFNRQVSDNNFPNTAFIAPMITAGDGNKLYLGADRRLKLKPSWSTDAGPAFINASAQLAAAVVTMSAAPSDPNRIYMGMQDGDLVHVQGNVMTRLAGSRFYNWITDVQESPHDNKVVMIANPQQGVTRRVMITYDRTAVPPVWTDLTGTGPTSLPSTSVNAVAFDPHNAQVYYVGTDIGCFVTTNGGSTWQNLNAAGLPNVRVNDLWINPGKTYLYAATFGRGIWRIPLVSGSMEFSFSAAPRLFGGQTLPLSFTFDSPTTVGSHIQLRTWTPDIVLPEIVSPPVGVTSWTYYATTNRVTAIGGGSIRATYGGSPRTAVSLLYPYPSMTLTLNKSTMYGGENANATVRFGTGLPFPTTVILYDNAGPLITPSTVTIPAWGTSTMATLTSVPVVTPANATVTAYLGGDTVAQTLSIQPYPLIATFQLSSDWVYGGEPAYGTIDFSKPLAMPLSVKLSSSGAVASVPGSLNFKNSSAASFTITTQPVVTGTWVDITAKVGTLNSGISRRLSVLALPLISNFTVNPAILKGAGQSIGTLQLANIAPKAGATIALSTSSTLVSVPDTITISPGKTSGSFVILAKAPSKTTKVTLTAYYNKAVRTATLTLSP